MLQLTRLRLAADHPKTLDGPIEALVDSEEEELDALLAQAVVWLRDARGDASRIRQVVDRYLTAGESQDLSPMELRDYFDISTPGLVDEAGYSRPEQAEAARLFDEVSNARYGGPSN